MGFLGQTELILKPVDPLGEEHARVLSPREFPAPREFDDCLQVDQILRSCCLPFADTGSVEGPRLTLSASTTRPFPTFSSA